jgi:hypothetical protein
MACLLKYPGVNGCERERLKMGEMLQNINLCKGVLLTPTHMTFLPLFEVCNVYSS